MGPSLTNTSGSISSTTSIYSIAVSLRPGDESKDEDEIMTEKMVHHLRRGELNSRLPVGKESVSRYVSQILCVEGSAEGIRNLGRIP